jgi:hypothetical protein
LTDSSPLFTKVEGLNKEQKELLEKAIYKFIINNKMCSTEFKPITKNNKESTNSDLRKKVDDHQRQVRKPKPAQKRMETKSTTKKPKDPAEIDEDGFILVAGKTAARRTQQQIQPQQAAKGQPTTQYEVLSSDKYDEEEESKSDEEDKDEKSKSDEDEESQSEEEDNNKKKAPTAKQSRLTRELRALGISQESDETSEEPRPSRSKMTRELRSIIHNHHYIQKQGRITRSHTFSHNIRPWGTNHIR